MRLTEACDWFSNPDADPKRYSHFDPATPAGRGRAIDCTGDPDLLDTAAADAAEQHGGPVLKKSSGANPRPRTGVIPMKTTWLVLILAACLPLAAGADCDFGAGDALRVVDAVTGGGGYYGYGGYGGGYGGGYYDDDYWDDRDDFYDDRDDFYDDRYDDHGGGYFGF